MSWETVEAAIRFWSGPSDTWGNSGANSRTPFTSAQQDQILGMLRQLYFGSPYAQALLEGGTSNWHFISLFQTGSSVPGFAPEPEGNGVAGYNLDALSHQYIFNSVGKVVQLNPALIIIHELFHAIL
jgi:hypothetical protein